jgi:hypothetical protein
VADPRIGDSPHDLLLALAGRLDDDLLAACRELVAVGEDGRAVELACAALAADRAALPPAVRAALVAAARANRTDLDAGTALPPAADSEVPHRFDATLPVVDELAAAVAGLPDRQVAGCRLYVTARTTPAGAAPGPLPQPVVVAEVGADDARPLDVLAYRLATACARVGVTVPVEVVVAGTALPAYQSAALRAARRVGEDRPATTAPPATPPAAPAADPPLEGPRWSEPERAVAPAPGPAAVPGAAGPVSDAEPAPVEPVPADPAAADVPAVERAAEPVVAEHLPAPSGSEPPVSRRSAWSAARRTGPRSALADRMAEWDAPAASGPVRDAEPGGPPDHRPAGPERATAADPVDDHPTADGPEPVDDHPPFEERRAGPDPAAGRDTPDPAAGPDPEEAGRARAPQEAVDDPAEAPAPVDDEAAAPAEPVPFTRVDSGPVSFEPASADLALDDRRPRWPATGGLVLPRRRRAADPAPADEPPAPVDEQAPPSPSRRPAALRPLLRAAPETGGWRARPAAPGDEPPQHAVVRPLRPAPPAAPALASLIDPVTGPRPPSRTP